jgi:ATP-dependent RNA helicase DBP3
VSYIEDTTMAETAVKAPNYVLKTIKKFLKKQDSGEMKLKGLAKKIAGKLDDDSISAKQVKQWIEDSFLFTVEDKMVSLKRPRTESSKETDEELPKASKKPKLNENPVDSSSVSTWRKSNKIVIMHATDDAEGKDKSLELQGFKTYFPFTSFDTPAIKACICAPLLKQCTEGNGFSVPSPIQAQSWPILCQDVEGKKRDIVGIAETGSGKTLAFVLPALSAMSEAKTGKHRLPRMLVLSPTRELAMQSDVVLREFGAVVSLKSLVIYGGVPKWTQTNELKKGDVDCIVATPGRIKDLMQEGSCDLSGVEYLVLDEADRMLDMGFEEDVRAIISECKSKDKGRHTYMFSATWPEGIQKIAMDYMVDPVRVYVGFDSVVAENGANEVLDDSLSANKRVTQTIEVIEDRQREGRLREILNKVHGKRNNRILIFALYKKEAERLEYNLKKDGWNCCSIHGNKNQPARTEALAQFKDGSCPLLVATDVAARGLDIPNVEYVINFTFPLTIEDYVHRIGRTGRAGKSGTSFTFFQSGDKARAGELQAVMRQADQKVPEALMQFGNTIKKKEHKLYGNFGPKGSEPMKKAKKIKFDNSDDDE